MMRVSGNPHVQKVLQYEAHAPSRWFARGIDFVVRRKDEEYLGRHVEGSNQSVGKVETRDFGYDSD